VRCAAEVVGSLLRSSSPAIPGLVRRRGDGPCGERSPEWVGLCISRSLGDSAGGGGRLDREPGGVAGNDIDADHAADRLPLGHSAVTARERPAPNAERHLDEAAARAAQPGRAAPPPVLRNRPPIRKKGPCREPAACGGYVACGFTSGGTLGENVGAAGRRTRTGRPCCRSPSAGARASARGAAWASAWRTSCRRGGPRRASLGRPRTAAEKVGPAARRGVTDGRARADTQGLDGTHDAAAFRRCVLRVGVPTVRPS
jgi:hypothetical protein